MTAPTAPVSPGHPPRTVRPGNGRNAETFGASESTAVRDRRVYDEIAPLLDGLETVVADTANWTLDLLDAVASAVDRVRRDLRDGQFIFDTGPHRERLERLVDDLFAVEREPSIRDMAVRDLIDEAVSRNGFDRVAVDGGPGWSFFVCRPNPTAARTVSAGPYPRMVRQLNVATAAHTGWGTAYGVLYAPHWFPRWLTVATPSRDVVEDACQVVDVDDLQSGVLADACVLWEPLTPASPYCLLDRAVEAARLLRR